MSEIDKTKKALEETFPGTAFNLTPVEHGETALVKIYWVGNPEMEEVWPVAKKNLSLPFEISREKIGEGENDNGH